MAATISTDHAASALDLVAATIAAVVRLDDVDACTAPLEAPLFLTADATTDASSVCAAALAALTERLAHGARLTVFVDPVAAPLLPALTGTTAGEVVLHQSATNPLVATTDAVLTGQGPLDGLCLTVGDAVVVRGPGATLAADQDGDPVVLDLMVEHGSFVVVGSLSPLSERLLGSRDNLAFLTWAATGQVRTSLAAHVAAHRSPLAGHRTPPVVASPAMEPQPLPSVGIDDPAFATAAGKARRLLPAVVHDALVDFMDSPDPAGALLVKGLPVGDLPPTPEHPTAPAAKDHTSEMTLLTAARCLGQPIGYLPEHGGDLVQNIVPTRGAATTQTSTSSAVELMYHTEAAFHPHRPRYLLLLCLKGDPAAATTLSSIHEVARQLPLDVRATLFEARFRTAADESYVGRRPTQLGLPMPVLTGSWDTPSMVFDADLMVGIDDEADAALRTLADAVVACHTSVVLEQGDLLVVDNSIAVHGRTPFTPRFDGTDRWLQRTFVVADLAASAGDRAGRVITTRFVS